MEIDDNFLKTTAILNSHLEFYILYVVAFTMLVFFYSCSFLHIKQRLDLSLFENVSKLNLVGSVPVN